MRTVITGGAGFIGSALAGRIAKLSNPGDEVILVDSLRRHGKHADLDRFLENPIVRLHEADLCEPSALSDIVTPVDRVDHLAARVGVGPVTRSPAEILKINTISTMNVVDWFCECASATGRLLFSSSSEVYAGTLDIGAPLKVPTPEDVPAVVSALENPRFSYALSKMWGEMYVRFVDPGSARKVVSIRYHNVYGPSMGYDHVIPEIVERVRAKQDPFELFSEEETRSFCWVGDAAKATHMVMESDKVESGMVVHIGNQNEETKIGKLYDSILGMCDWRPSRIEHKPSPPGSVQRRCPDVSLLLELTGYSPTTPLADGLPKTVDWYLANPSTA